MGEQHASDGGGRARPTERSGVRIVTVTARSDGATPLVLLRP